ncbi:MAG TPA: lysylphosphatidylglycerol synthase transmembrane domain-containing protein [Burkholderiales bacterium]|nr:lysylphosphatidylglycerol synthase transmembrane domain-containing protein [Burkholderiales bacterium]
MGVALLGYVLARLDLERFGATLAGARGDFLLVVPVAIVLEQLVRAWKWRQLLYALRPAGTLRLFGAIMAGYLGSMLIPGASPLLRSWLIARREGLRMSAVFATVAIDRLVDGIVFALLVAIVLVLAVFPDPDGNIHRGLAVGAAASLALFGAALWLLARYKRALPQPGGWEERLLARLPQRFQAPMHRIAASFADGIVWPRQRWRQAAIVLASLAIKLIAASHFFWAGLAFDVRLAPLDYLFLIVFLGFIVILTHFIRLAGGFIVGGIFALGLFGVAEEQALAMVLTLQLSSVLTVAAIGAFAMWRYGVALGDVRALSRGAHGAGPV